MKGTELAKATKALDTVEELAHYRPETAHRAVGAVLSLLGARRLLRGAMGGPDGILERQYLKILAQIEDAAIRLDAIPTQTDKAEVRGEVWDEILEGVAEVREMLDQEQKLATAKDRRRSA